MTNLIDRAAKLIQVIIILVGLVVLISLSNFRLSLAQDKSSGLRNVIQSLVDKKVDIYIQFAHPTSEGKTEWTIPEDIEYEGKISGRRIFDEVGDDYICAKEVGQGITNVYCVPFSNISYVSYLSP